MKIRYIRKKDICLILNWNNTFERPKKLAARLNVNFFYIIAVFEEVCGL